MPDLFDRIELVDNTVRVIPFLPAVRAERPSAPAMRAGVHHDHAIAITQEKLSVSECARPIVGHPMELHHPIAVGMGRPDFPPFEPHTVGSEDTEVLSDRTSAFKDSSGFLPSYRIQVLRVQKAFAQFRPPSVAIAGERRRNETAILPAFLI
jgi:hypothetical protein